MESIGLPYSDENRCDSSELDGVPSVASRYAGGLSPRVERCDQRIRQEDEFRIFERADIEESIPARFAKQVRQYPDSVAVSWDGLRLTYKELNQEANRTACEILKRIGDAEEPVAFLLDHGGWAIAAILGILKAGKGYLALDPSFPRDRTAALLHDSTARLVVTEEKHLPLVGPTGREKTMILSRRLGSQGSMDDPAVGILPSLRDTRIAILARLGPSGFDRWITVKGLPHLQQALHRGRGVILLDSHYGLPHFEMVTLQRLGLENVLVIGGWPTQMQLLGIKHWRQIKMREDYEPAKRFMMGPIAMQAAREFLAAGGIVRMAPDGDVGAGGSSFPFWGRERTFRHGFANLVVDTAASALPTMVTLESSGRVQVEFFEPFDPGDVTESRKARVERLVMHYVRFLEGMWALHPGNVREADLQAFLAARACSLVTMQGPTMFESE